MSPTAQSAFSDKLRQLIAARGLTQTELASKTGKAAALELQLREQTEKLAQRDGELTRLRAALSANAATIAALQADKAKEGGRALFAGVIGALAGAALSKSGDR